MDQCRSEQNETNCSLPSVEYELLHIRWSVMPLTICIGIVAILGAAGNLLVLVVCSTGYPKSNFRYFVMSMALVDLISCLTTLPAEIYSQMNWYTYRYDWICRIKCFFNVFTVWGSASILLILAIDRYRKITKPLAWQIPPSLARKSCLVIIIVAVAMAVPAAGLWGQQTYVYQNGGESINVSICEKSNQYADDIYPLVYTISVYIGTVGLMTASVTCLNILTAKSLFCNRDTRIIPKHFFIPKLGPKSKLAVQDVARAYTCENTSAVNNGSFKFLEEMKYTHNVSNCEEPCPTISSSFNLRWMANPCNILKENQNNLDICSRRKTVIMFILSSVFITTIVVYIIISALVSSTDSIIRNRSTSSLVELFVVWRLYFINCVVNPIIYGFTDPRFRSGLKDLLKKNSRG